VRGGQVADPRGLGEHAGERLLACQVNPRRHAAEVLVGDPGPLRAGQLRPRLAQHQQHIAVVGEAHRHALADVLDQAEHADDRGGMDGRRAGGVVEADVAARDRDAQFGTAVGEPAYRLGELPHHRRILRRAEVQAVGDGDRGRAGDGHVAVRLGQRQLRALVRVEPRVPAVSVDRQGDAQMRLLVDPDDAGVLGLGEHGVAQHVPVVLLGDPGLVAEIRRRDHPQ
jgi:hypothetical protein